MSPDLETLTRLVDHDGTPVSAEWFDDRMILVYFGFTSCPVVCPRALTKLTAALAALGQEADRYRPLMITVDPDRDSPMQMKEHLRQYPQFTGLTGTAEDLEITKRAFRVFARRKVDLMDPDGYALAHTAFAYVLGPEGTMRAHLGDHLRAPAITEALRDALMGTSE